MKLDNRIWILLTGVLAIALGAGGYFLGVAPQLAALADAQQQKADVDLSNQVLSAEIGTLQEASGNLPALKQEAAALAAQIPTDVDSSAFIDSLSAMADDTHVVITNLDLGEAEPYEVPVLPGATTTATTTTTDSATAAPTDAAAEPVAPEGAPLPTTSGLITAGNFVVVPVTITVRGSYGAGLNFAEGVQTGDRLVLVSGVDSQQEADGNGKTYTTTLTGLIYVLPTLTAAPPAS